MTSKNQQIDLPRIPSLPPIQMPEPSGYASTSSSNSHRPRLSSRSPPAAPLSSQETILTARSASTAPETNGAYTVLGEDLLLPPSPHSLSPSTLRKSISVDSFIKAKQPPPQATRAVRGSPMPSNLAPPQEAPQRGSTPSLPSDSTPSAIRAFSRERDKRSVPPLPTTSRSRGTSISTSTDRDEREGASFFDGSEVERSDDLPRRARRSTTISRQTLPPPGELGLPSRLQNMNSVPNISTSQPPPPIVPTRSSSLKSPNQKTAMSVDTHIPPLPQAHQISIAVIGAAGCGKSTVIRKGLKAYMLSEPIPTSLLVSPTTPDDDDSFTYSYRIGRISVGPNQPDCILRVLEVDISALDLSQCGAQQWEKSSLDGVVICYDAGRQDSFLHIADCLHEFSHLKLPMVVLACKSDLESRVNREHAAAVTLEYDVGLIEVCTVNQAGKEKIRTAFEWLFKAIFYGMQPSGSARSDRDGYRNPASPSVLGSTPPWDISRASSATPTTATVVSQQMAQLHTPTHPLSQSQTPMQTLSQPPSQTSTGTLVPTQLFRLPSPNSATSSRTPTTPTSPTRARSTSDLLSEHEKSRREEREQYSVGRTPLAGSSGSPVVRSRGSLNALSGNGGSKEGLTAVDESIEMSREASMRESRAPPWMTLDELLNKLLFMAVSDDDPTFISHFFLTYRRFASPRSVLLAMQRRMRALDNPTGDPMFACYAQLRICLLLDKWMERYPGDFAVSGASSALTALIKSMLSKTYLLHYGASFLQFLEHIPKLKDRDSVWALKVDEESDDSPVPSEDEGIATVDLDAPDPAPVKALDKENSLSSPNIPVAPRDRKSSLPLTAKAFVMGGSLSSQPNSAGGDIIDQSSRQFLKRLCQVGEDMYKVDNKEIAQEITRVEAQFFLMIEPRHWLQHVFVQGKKNPETDPIAKYNHISNHIADWTVSLILCYDKPKQRARQIEKLVDIALELRFMHNYSALRAVVAGINSATFEGDRSLEQFKTKAARKWRKFQSFDHLLQSVRSHQKYRMALRNTKDACIPALEIHLSDLIRAHEGNSDYHDDDPSKIHWAKFNMMAKFIDIITQCQDACRTTAAKEYKEARGAPDYLLLLKDDWLMDIEMQRSRIAPPDTEGAEEVFKSDPQRTFSRDTSHQSKDAQILRKIFFW